VLEAPHGHFAFEFYATESEHEVMAEVLEDDPGLNFDGAVSFGFGSLRHRASPTDPHVPKTGDWWKPSPSKGGPPI
jgi:hypothetical protein